MVSNKYDAQFYVQFHYTFLKLCKVHNQNILYLVWQINKPSNSFRHIQIPPTSYVGLTVSLSSFWNSLPKEIKLSLNVKTFRKQLKDNIFLPNNVNM